MRLMKQGAEAIGHGDRFKQLELAVSFDPDFTPNPDDPYDETRSKTFINAQGVEQGTCVHLGNCDIGCEVYAKNTLDRNYIPWAEKHGAEVRELHLVSNIEPITDGYRVSFDRLKTASGWPAAQTARIVIVACGSLGSTELLLRCRDLNGSLPRSASSWGTTGAATGTS